ncbi:MAG: SIMPL domain-containing protein [Candidatus Brennerbacteria bacterium]
MTEKFKNYVWGAVIVGILAVSYAAVSYVRTYSQSIEPSSFRSFSVTADAKVVAVPDVAAFTASVITEGGLDLGALQTANTESTNKVIAYVKENGVDAKDVKTEGYSVEPRYQYYGCEMGACPPSRIVGYTVRQTVSVKVRDFTKAGAILGGVVTNGANSVSSLTFTIDDQTEVQAEARAEAIEKAKAKAELIADEAGFTIGRLLSIDEGGLAYPVPMYERAYGMGGAGDAVKSVPSIEPGSQDVRVTVTLRYEIR